MRSLVLSLFACVVVAAVPTAATADHVCVNVLGTSVSSDVHQPTCVARSDHNCPVDAELDDSPVAVFCFPKAFGYENTAR